GRAPDRFQEAGDRHGAPRPTGRGDDCRDPAGEHGHPLQLWLGPGRPLTWRESSDSTGKRPCPSDDSRSAGSQVSPMASRARRSTGSDDSLARSAPARSTSSTYAGSAASSSYRLRNGSSTALTASATSRFSAP